MARKAWPDDGMFEDNDGVFDDGTDAFGDEQQDPAPQNPVMNPAQSARYEAAATGGPRADLARGANGHANGAPRGALQLPANAGPDAPGPGAPLTRGGPPNRQEPEAGAHPQGGAPGRSQRAATAQKGMEVVVYYPPDGSAAQATVLQDGKQIAPWRRATDRDLRHVVEHGEYQKGGPQQAAQPAAATTATKPTSGWGAKEVLVVGGVVAACWYWYDKTKKAKKGKKSPRDADEALE